MTRYIIVGDTHGCLQELLALANKVQWNPERDRLILAGDLVDRGPQSAELVQWARINKVEIVRGNHDDRYVYMRKQMRWHAENPGNTKPQWLKTDSERLVIYKKMSQEDLDFLENAPVCIWLDDVHTVVVHAGFMPHVKFEDQDEQTMMHIRFLYDHQNRYLKAPLDATRGFSQPLNSFFWAEQYDEDWNVVYGHHVWDLEKIRVDTNQKGAKCYGIDTGCCFGGMLTALVLTPDKEPDIIQVPSRQRKI